MRTPNCECVVCGKPLYRRPFELRKVNYVCCRECRGVASKIYPNESSLKNLELGRAKGTNHLEGIPKTESHKEKIKNIMKKWCEEHREKVIERGKNSRGENHYNWKGGNERIAVVIRTMTETDRWKKDILKRDEVCKKCGTALDLEVHHIIAISELVEKYEIETVEDARKCDLLWDVKNGVVLCRKCHCEEHGIRYVKKGKGRRKTTAKPKRRLKGKDNPNWKGGLVKKICPICGNEFYVKKCEVNKRKTCSRKCSAINQRGDNYGNK